MNFIIKSFRKIIIYFHLIMFFLWIENLFIEIIENIFLFEIAFIFCIILIYFELFIFYNIINFFYNKE
jgi:hypothetical protein